MRTVLGFDFETYSNTDIGSCGSYKYMEDPAFEILLLSYAFDDEPVKTVDFTAGETWPTEFLDALNDRSVIKTAWNCDFERYALARTIGYQEPEFYEDTMILAASCGLPLSLDGCGKALNLGSDAAKMKEGKALIRYFSCPTKRKDGTLLRHYPNDAPDRWLVYKQYNARDVEAERTIRNMLLKWKPDETEHRFWAINAHINDRGIRIDDTLARSAMAMDKRYKDELLERATAISGLANPNSTQQVKDWLLEQEGLEVPSLNKKVIADVVASLSSDSAREFMELRSEFSKSASKKYEAMLRSQCEDGTVKGTMLFHGARTGRFAGRLIQPQNFAQNHMPDLETARELVRRGDYETVKCLYENVSGTLGELTRTALIPDDGHKFLVADYSAIEARVIAWIAGEQWRKDVFANGGDIYCASASQMFKCNVVKNGENGHLRQKGKIAELALGYGGGPNALKAFGADKMGMTEEEMGETVALWRESSPHIVALWSALEKAAIRCVSRKTPQKSTVGGILFTYDDGIMWMHMPSGRRLPFYGAAYEEGTGLYSKGRKVLSYLGINQKTKKWERIETFGGRLAENLCQGCARDCLRESMMLLDSEGFDIRFTIHDEVVINEPINGRSYKDVCEVMGRPIPWADGLVLRGDGYDTPFYQKD